jgi:nucleotide-binding universal stress UspA family protein
LSQDPARLPEAPRACQNPVGIGRRRLARVSKILVGFDGTEEARRALDRAIELAQPGDEVTVVAALPEIVWGAAGSHEDSFKRGDSVADARAHLDEAAEKLTARGIPTTTLQRNGDPADVIVETAKAGNYDTIVVGSRGHGFAKRLLVGSVSTGVLHHATCDVLVVH